ncbi:glycosyltransferase-like domain-containing protein 1 isoform X2 [Cimex lectularius]|uniref:tRNA-queuosine alpha-mannosyltransferase n=1 Tax=Cimex lectularius TaxID=79782 RepID=A0A8I6SF70_CIMLE|nr:glycosyltransferase-like domain-containing protein 1 isoform X2 [Cimex lectularius]
MSLYEILLIEPFYTGSHKMLIDKLNEVLGEEFGKSKICFISMKGKKWHWRARTSAIYLSQNIPFQHSFRVIFATSVLNLSELIALREDLRNTKKIIYFHENQLNYPRQEYKDRDFQYGYNEVLTCLVADLVIFNSMFNRDSFLNGIKKHFDILPDYRPKSLKERIENKSHVIYFPILNLNNPVCKNYNVRLHIVWPHRWEHDKNPRAFLNVICRLSKNSSDFDLSMIGEQFTDQDTFEEIRKDLGDHIANWGYVHSKEDYFQILSKSHIAVSTADHEFFGVSMLEAAQRGCLPLCPDKLVYPELYPSCCLYKNYEELYNRLVYFCTNVHKIKSLVQNLNVDRYNCKSLIPEYIKLFR